MRQVPFTSPQKRSTQSTVCPSVRPCARLAVSLSMFMMMMNFQLQSESMHFYHNQQPKSKSWHEGVILSNFDTLHKLSRSRNIATVHEIESDGKHV